ncbi:MAG TPA: DUF6152 family protein [Gammaproteobacteria bacterium]|nr:DUF6152 family protein [Gammaproteobacteria bacterium]
MHTRTVALLAGLALSGIGTSASAHHAFSSVFDPATSIDLIGTVTKVEWTNPHIWFYIDVVNEDGDVVNWGFEMGSPNTLVRRGWSHDSLAIGNVVVVAGALARDGTSRAAVRSVTLQSGERLFGGQNESQ